MRILHIHDNGPWAMHTSFVLKSLNVAVDGVRSIGEAAEAIAIQPYDLALLDVDEAPTDAVGELVQLREELPEMQILVCGSNNSINEVASAMENGAQDFILRPVHPEELRIRVMNVCSRGNADDASRPGMRNVFGPLELSLLDGGVMLDGVVIRLTPRERGVLHALVRAGGGIVSKDKIASSLFSFDDEADPKAIETYVHRLRRKAEHHSLKIETVRGVGYRLVLRDDI